MLNGPGLGTYLTTRLKPLYCFCSMELYQLSKHRSGITCHGQKIYGNEHLSYYILFSPSLQWNLLGWYYSSVQHNSIVGPFPFRRLTTTIPTSPVGSIFSSDVPRVVWSRGQNGRCGVSFSGYICDFDLSGSSLQMSPVVPPPSCCLHSILTQEGNCLMSLLYYC